VLALLAIFTLSATDSRRNASLGDSINNLKQFVWAGSSFTADRADQVWTFSWRAGPESPSEYPDLEAADTDLQAAANQAVDIIRRRADPAMPRISNWLPQLFYSHLVLADHLNLPLPTPWAVSPGDDNRLAWQQWPNNPIPLPPPPDDPRTRRWVYSSSYELGTAFFHRDQRSATEFTIEQGATHSAYINVTPSLPMGDRLITQVVFPSHKAMLWEQHQRFFGSRVAFFAYPEARIPVLTVDGSVLVRAATESNLGFRPNQPTSGLATQFTYSPAAFEPPVPPGSPDSVSGRYRWTRGGLTGRDFGAPEVCTGQDGCTP
jgi:hypothetical protein